MITMINSAKSSGVNFIIRSRSIGIPFTPTHHTISASRAYFEDLSELRMLSSSYRVSRPRSGRGNMKERASPSFAFSVGGFS